MPEPVFKPPVYTFPDMESWKQHVNSRQNKEELNDAVRVLNLGKTRVNIHPFVINDQMGYAIGILNKRAEQLKLYKMGNGFYQNIPTKPLP